jgi:hypothetical protein
LPVAAVREAADRVERVVDPVAAPRAVVLVAAEVLEAVASAAAAGEAAAVWRRRIRKFPRV